MFAVTQTASKALAAPSEASKTRPGRVVVAKAVPHSVIESGKKAVLTGFLAATVALSSVDPADASTVALASSSSVKTVTLLFSEASASDVQPAFGLR